MAAKARRMASPAAGTVSSRAVWRLKYRCCKRPARGSAVTATSTEGALGTDVRNVIFEETGERAVTSLFPEEVFIRECEALGFNRNSAIISLMPILAHIRKDAF